MDKIKIIKLLTIISFLLIVFPDGKLQLFNIQCIFLGVIGSFINLLCTECGSYMETIMNLCFFTIVLISIVFIFKQKRIIVLSSIVSQYIYIIYYSDFTFFQYWYYSIPVLIYIVLSLLLIFNIFIRKSKISNI